MRNKFLIFVAMLSLSAVAFSQTPTTQVWHVGITTVPATSTLAVGAISASHYIFIDRMLLSNTSDATVTVTVTDQGTNCNGGPCQLFPAVTIAAKTVYSVELNGTRLYGGVMWSASTVNVVNGWMSGRY